MISQLLIYSLKSALTLTLLYVPYTLMLQKERFFRLNRIVLLCITAFSLLLPLCNVSWMSLDRNPIVQATHQQMIEVGIPVRVADDGITVSYQLAEDSTSLSWFTVLAIVFFVGMAVSVVIRCLQLGILSYMMRYKNLWTKRQEDGIRVCCRKGGFTPYSWMKTIFISEEDWNDGRREIVLHETGHIRAHHSWDMLLLMFCQALQWYNPFAWMIGSSLSDVHEYEADDYVLRQGVSQRDYMMMLVKKVAMSQGYSFVNGLNKSTLNKRILMMKESVASNPWMRAKLLYLLPVCALVLSAFATPKITAPVEKALTKLENRSPEKANTGQEGIASETKDVKAGDRISGQVVESPSDGTPLSGVKVSQVTADSRVVGVAITDFNGHFEMPVNDPENELVFTKEGYETIRSGIAHNLYLGLTSTSYINPNKGPMFAGGEIAFQKHLSSNLSYPREAQATGTTGTYLVSLIINEDGNIKDVNILPNADFAHDTAFIVKGNAPSFTAGISQEKSNQAQLALQQEILRVIKTFPRFIPAENDGKKLDSGFNFSIAFVLN